MRKGWRREEEGKGGGEYGVGEGEMTERGKKIVRRGKGNGKK